MYCISVDGAVSSGKQKWTVGMVIRDHLGQLCVVRGVPIPKLCSPLEVELLATKEALNWCKNSRFSIGEVFTDSQTAVNLTNTNPGYLGFACFLVKDVISLFRVVQVYLVSLPFVRVTKWPMW